MQQTHVEPLTRADRWAFKAVKALRWSFDTFSLYRFGNMTREKVLPIPLSLSPLSSALFIPFTLFHFLLSSSPLSSALLLPSPTLPPHPLSALFPNPSISSHLSPPSPPRLRSASLCAKPTSSRPDCPAPLTRHRRGPRGSSCRCCAAACSWRLSQACLA